MLEKIDAMLDASVTDPKNPEKDSGIPVMPTRAHEHDAGLDLYSPYFVRIPPQSCRAINTGVHIVLPVGYAGIVESRSGMNRKGIFCQGRIDAGYTGAIEVNLFNLSEEPYDIYAHDRIAQLVIHQIETPVPVVVESFPETERNDKGFGSTGA